MRSTPIWYALRSMTANQTSDADRQAGLCARCRHVRIIRSSKGSVFYMCRRAANDPRFLRYPPLPVSVCEGFEASDDTPTAKPEHAPAERTAAPVGGAERITAIDALRGFALFGILVVNIEGFSMNDATWVNPTAYGSLEGLNYWAWYANDLFFEYKFMAIFSMLFGAGILLMSGRTEAKGVRSAPLHYRRMLVLLVIGLCHAYLFWNGDILVWYSMCGLLVYLFRNRRATTLIAMGIGGLAVGSALFVVSGWSMPHWPPEAMAEFVKGFNPTSEDIARDIAAHRGGWLSQVAFRAPYSLGMQTSVFFFWGIWRVSGLMLLGMGLFKSGVLAASRSNSFYLALLGVGLLVGLPVVGFGIHQQFRHDWAIEYSFFKGTQYNYWGSVLTCLGYAGGIMLLVNNGVLTPLTSRLAAVGRMALTNYLMQTIICTTIFYGHGFGLYGRVERTEQLLIVLAICACQLVLSPLWLGKFRFGPMEWVWRSLTYGKRQPFRRA